MASRAQWRQALSLPERDAILYRVQVSMWNGLRSRAAEAWLRVPGMLSAAGAQATVVEWLTRSIEVDRRHSGDLSVLCLDRQNFSRDIGELRARTRLNWHVLRHKLLGIVQAPWTPARARRQMFYFSEKGPEVERARARAALMFAAFLRQARRWVGLDAVLSANNDYWQDEAMRMACRDVGVPFLVLSREHYITHEKAAERVRRYRESGFRFTGTAVAVFGPATRRTMIDAGVCDPDRVVQTGAPRLDVWRDAAGAPANADGVLLFSFCRTQYGAPVCAGEALEALNRLGGQGVRVTVKCKNEEDRGLVLSRLGAVNAGVRLTLGDSVEALVRGARVVVGFNSLAVLEAMLSHAVVVVPYWGDAAACRENLMLDPDDPACQGAVHFARSAEDLERTVLRLLAEGEELGWRERRLELCRRFFHFPADRTCSAEVEAFVRRFTKG